jgi:hypothetical protein
VLVLAEDVAPPPEVLAAATAPRPAAATNVHGGGASWDDSMRSNPHNREHMLAATWARQSTEATGGLIAMLAGGSPAAEQQARPATAPHGMSEARRRYQEAQVANLDLFHCEYQQRCPMRTHASQRLEEASMESVLGFSKHAFPSCLQTATLVASALRSTR